MASGLSEWRMNKGFVGFRTLTVATSSHNPTNLMHAAWHGMGKYIPLSYQLMGTDWQLTHALITGSHGGLTLSRVCRGRMVIIGQLADDNYVVGM